MFPILAMVVHVCGAGFLGLGTAVRLLGRHRLYSSTTCTECTYAPLPCAQEQMHAFGTISGLVFALLSTTVHRLCVSFVAAVTR